MTSSRASVTRSRSSSPSPPVSRSGVAGSRPSSFRSQPRSRCCSTSKTRRPRRPRRASWASVMTAGVGLIARGRLHPAVSPSGVDAWRAGPLDPGDHILLEQLANAMPPLGHAVPLAGAKPPLRVHSPAFLVAAAWDALADTLPRTSAAATASGSTLFAATEPTPATELRPWLAEASAGLDGGASFALRVQLGDAARAGAQRRAADLQHCRPEPGGRRGRPVRDAGGAARPLRSGGRARSAPGATARLSGLGADRCPPQPADPGRLAARRRPARRPAFSTVPAGSRAPGSPFSGQASSLPAG